MHAMRTATSARRAFVLLALAPVLAAASLAGCGDAPGGSPRSEPAPMTWHATLRAARGQHVRWWMYGGDERGNAYVDRYVIPAARRLGVQLERVPVADTADAVARVVAERRAGRRSGGAVDLIWINGENFAAGSRVGLWLRDWATRLPDARFLDGSDPAIASDFRVPVDGQESPWSRAAFVFAYDRARMPAPPRTLDALLAWARGHPGRVTYPAPPDFTGSAFVRQVVQSKGEHAAFAYLRALRPLMYRDGTVLPKSEAELDDLFANGQVDIAMSYDAGFVQAGVAQGRLPASTRPFVLDGGTLTNVSFVTIPADASHRAGAEVVANLLLSPAQQAIKADPRVLASPTVLDRARLPGRARARLDAVERSPYLLRSLGRARGELGASAVAPLEQRWKREILRGSGSGP